MDVGVRELKQHLSEYLERAARGEIIRVTDRGLPKAILAPLPGVARIEQGVVEGWIRAANDAPPTPVVRVKSNLRSEDILREDRGD